MISDNLWQGQRVRLTGLTRDDMKTVATWHNDAGFLRLQDATAARPYSEEELAKWLEDARKDERSFRFAVRPVDGDTLIGDALIGVVGLEDILWTHGVAWLSIAIGDRENWGQGYGREALTLLLNYAFSELNLYRVQLTVFAYNVRAIALYERLGFKREGVYREFMQRDGKRHDMYLYGLLSREWGPRTI